MDKIVILGLTTCKRCKNLLALLLSKSLNFEYINLDEYKDEIKEEVRTYKKYIHSLDLTDVPIILHVTDTGITPLTTQQLMSRS